MGRNKAIDDTELIKMVDEFFFKICNGNGMQLKIPALGNYIRQNGYPNLKDYIIRRNSIVVAHIDELKRNDDADKISLVSVYKSIDTTKFIEVNRGDSKMKKALTSLDQYYKSIADAASIINKKYIDLEKQHKQLKNDYQLKMAECEQIKQKYDLSNGDIVSYKNEISKLNQIIKTYVYPEIANELLANESLLKNTTKIIKEKALENEIITSETKVTSNSNLIKGMFDKFGE